MQVPAHNHNKPARAEHAEQRLEAVEAGAESTLQLALPHHGEGVLEVGRARREGRFDASTSPPTSLCGGLGRAVWEAIVPLCPALLHPSFCMECPEGGGGEGRSGAERESNQQRFTSGCNNLDNTGR